MVTAKILSDLQARVNPQIEESEGNPQIPQMTQILQNTVAAAGWRLMTRN
jgi:hypothetical protein